MTISALQIEQLNTKVFISYSRQDSGFVDALHKMLMARGFDSFLDRNEIAPGENWRDRLDGLILAADAVVFVVTDAALSSEVCSWEVERTQYLGKRLVPLAHGPRTRAPPKALADLNFTFSDDPGGGKTLPLAPTEQAIDKLSIGIETDIRWVREHSRLTALANRWAVADDSSRAARLLRRGEVEAVKAWIRLRPGPSAPAIPSFLTAFVDASDAHEKLERERLLTVTGRGFVKPANHALAEGRFDEALRLSAAGMILGDDLSNSLVPERVHAISVGASENRLLTLFVGRGGGVRSAAFSPDGTQVVTGHDDKTARLWNVSSGTEVAVLRGHQQAVDIVEFAPDGNRVMTGSHDASVRIWDAAAGAELVRIQTSSRGGVWSAAFSADGTRIVTASEDKTARVWDAASGTALAAMHGHQNWLVTASFSPDGNRVVTASADDTARVWDTFSGEELTQVKGVPGLVPRKVATFSPDGSRIATVSVGNTARVWDAATGIELAAMSGHEGMILVVAFSRDGSRILTGSEDKTARIWDAITGAEMAVLRGHKRSVHLVDFSSDGDWVITGSFDETARVWHAATGLEFAALVGHHDALSAASFSPDGMRALTSSNDGTVRVWDVAPRNGLMLPHDEGPPIAAVFTPDGTRVLTMSDNAVSSVWDAANGNMIGIVPGQQEHAASIAAFSADRTRVAVASDGPIVRILDAALGSDLATLQAHEDEVTAVALSPDGARVVTGSKDWTVRIWDVVSGSELAVFRGHLSGLCTVAFSSDGSRVVAGALSGLGLIFDAKSMEELVSLDPPESEGAMFAAVFSPDGSRVATAASNNIVRVWDARTGGEIAVLRGHEGSVQTVAFSPEGARLLTGSDDCTARVWEAATGVQLAVLRGHKGYVAAGDFSPDGTRVVTTSGDGSARLWDVRRASAMLSPICLGLAASLANGRGKKTAREDVDLLMQSASIDLYEALIDKLVDGKSSADSEGIKAEVERRAAILSTQSTLNYCIGPSSRSSPNEKPTQRVPGFTSDTSVLEDRAAIESTEGKRSSSEADHSMTEAASEVDPSHMSPAALKGLERSTNDQRGARARRPLFAQWGPALIGLLLSVILVIAAVFVLRSNLGGAH